MTFAPLTPASASQITPIAEEACPFLTELAWDVPTRALAAAHGSGLSLWEQGFGDKATLTFTSETPLKCVAFSTDGQQIVCGGSGEQAIILRRADMSVVQRIDTGSPVNSTLFSNDGLQIVFGNADGQVILANNDGSHRQIVANHQGEVARIVGLPDERFASCGWDGAIKVMDANGRVPESIALTDTAGKPVWVRDMAASSEGRLAVVCADGTLVCVETLGGEPTVAYRVLSHEGSADAIAWHPSGKLLATGGRDGMVRMWQADTGEAIATLSGHRKTILSLVFVNNGLFLVSGSGDGRLILWGVER